MTRTLNSTPAADGFSMPAEFAPHAGCWMLWPERPDNWRRAAPAQRAFAEVAAAIARFEPVTVGVSAGHFESARAQLAAEHPGGGDDPRRRLDARRRSDFRHQQKGRRRGVDWRFNAWGGLEGGLYFPWDQDDLVARKVLEIEGCDRTPRPSSTKAAPSTSTGRGRTDELNEVTGRHKNVLLCRKTTPLMTQRTVL